MQYVNCGRISLVGVTVLALFLTLASWLPLAAAVNAPAIKTTNTPLEQTFTQFAGAAWNATIGWSFTVGTNVEPNETFFVNISNVTGAYVNDGQGLGTITNDDVPPFTDINAGLTGLDYGSVAWGDYDNDGDLDLLSYGSLFAGGEQTTLYRNDAGTFTSIASGLPNGANAEFVWGDYDNDGDLDLFVCANTNPTDIMDVYRNNGNGTFTPANAGFAPMRDVSAAWGDFDNDGDLDIVVAGFEQGDPITNLYRNDGGMFANANAGLTGFVDAAVAWGDYDNDGDPDILTSGEDINGDLHTRVCRNNGNGTFTELSGLFSNFGAGKVAWGDYDNDGDLDVLMAGYDAAQDITTSLYRNNSNGTFTLVNSGLTPLRTGSVAWGDYDNDGDLDVLGVGQSVSSQIVSKVFQNNAGTFTEIQSDLQGVRDGNAAWGDFDNDGDLDIALTGQDLQTGFFTKVYRNNTTTPNTIPSAPTGLTATPLSGNRIAFAWNAASDGQTPANGLSYNLRVGTTLNGVNTLSPMANLANGYRRIAARGPQQILRDTVTLPPGKYYWSVQAVDAALAGGPFSATDSVDTRPFVDINAGLPGLDDGSVAWGDYDNDGDLDVLLSGAGRSQVYRNNGDGTFTDNTNAGLMGVFYSSVAWGDYDNDGKLDILLAGNISGTIISKVYHNNGDGTFTDINAQLTGIFKGSGAWGDYDNDGRLDIVLSGQTNTFGQVTSKVYHNNGDGTFTEINAGLPGVLQGSVAWGDYDNDGKLDILLTGFTGSALISKVYRNNGDGTFTDINAGLTGVYFSSVAWGDYDNDGALDILLTGSTTGSNVGAISKVYHNNGNGTFTENTNAGLTGVFDRSSLAWGDYDNDGKLDILFTGRDASNARLSKVYRNNGNTTFTDINAGLPGMEAGSIAWGDYDSDGKLDILLAGYGGSRIAKIYRNTGSTPNTIPTAPTGLTATPLSGNRIAFAWSASSDNQTPANGLSYNLRVGTTLNGVNTLSPMANLANGYRRIAARGPQQILRDTVTLPPAQYYWSVQAIDAALAGGPFATEASFTSCAPFTNNRAYVNASAVGANNGTTWADAFTSLQSALAITGTCGITEIWVAAGTYTPTNTTDRGISFVMKNGVAIYGGFPNAGNPTPDDRNWTANPTILSGDIGTQNDSTDNSYHVIFNNFTSGAPLDTTAVLDGFTVTGGNANSVAPHCNGGGMYNLYASPKVLNCSFVNNTVVRSNATSTESAGGGMYNSNASPLVANCVFTNNKARAINTSGHSYGAGMYNSSGSPTITNCTFSNNMTPNDDEDTYGGGMFNENVTVTVTGSTFSNNQAVFGGGMRNSSSTVTISNCTFTGNLISTYPGGVNGGAINNHNSSGTISGCIFLNNAGVGAISVEVYSVIPILNISRCTFSGNNYGVANQSAAPTVTNCLFTGNTYGGVVNWTGSSDAPTIVNCTFSENPGSGLGSISNYGSTSPVLTNCILYGSGNSVFVQSGSVAPTVTYSNVKQASGVFAGAGNINQNPLYVNAADPDGADNIWMTADDGLALQNASPSINTGVNSGAPTTDIVGNPRPLTAGNRADMGAYESQYIPVHTFVVINTNGNGAGSLQQAITDANATANINASTPDTILFNIPGGGPHTITYSNLPSIVDPVIIDGYSQPGASKNTLADGNNAVLKIILQGLRTNTSPLERAEGDDPQGGWAGPSINTSNTTIQGLIINKMDGSLYVSGSGGNTIIGNFIGTDASGTAGPGNGYGILVYSSNNTIGGTLPGDRNIIALSAAPGVGILANPTGNRVIGNSMFGNGGPGIDLGSNGITANDVNDPDTGPNNLQNFPEMTQAKREGNGDLSMTYSVPSIAPNSTFPLRIEFFKAQGGQGKTFLSAQSYITPSAVTQTFAPAAPISAGDTVVATATDALGNTSEFSAGIVVVQPPFTDINAGLTGVNTSSVAWGDYDNDGDLDILLTGSDGSNRISKVYRNDGGTFTDINAGLTGVNISSVAWGDYDNDGDLDIVLIGYTGSNSISKVYRNNGAGTFTDVNAALTGVLNGSVVWGDYDNDGDLDILLTGSIDVSVTGTVSKVYRNDNGSFTDINAGLTGVYTSAVAWGDYDSDGDLDILLTGYGGSNRISKVYRNDPSTGSGRTFTDINAGLTGVQVGSVAWGDYDNDGDLDILMTGSAGGGVIVSKVYRNDGGGTFIDIGAGLLNVVYASVAWGDYDNDGYSDILLTGSTVTNGFTANTKLYRNNQNGTFTEVTANLAGIASGSAVWGDYDNDGDLDILLTGNDGQFNRFSKIYRNNTSTPNTIPTAPTGLTATPLSGNRIAFAWNASSDNQTPANGLSYNLRVGTTSGGVNVASPMAHVGNTTSPTTADGWRRIPKIGPKQILRDTLNVVGAGPFYWSVQGIDGALAGGPFATEQVITPDPSGIQSDDFNTSSLKPFWQFINPGNPSTMSLVGTGTADARLRIQVPDGASHDVWTAGNMAPRVMQNCNNIDFEVEVKFDGAMTSQYQIEGIIVEEDANRFLRFDFVKDNASTRLFAASFAGGSPTVLRDRVIPGGNPLWMRVKRVGNDWIQTYSTDGTNFVDFGTMTNVALNVTKIGPFVGNAGYPEGTAPSFSGLVDYFFSTASPIVPEDGVVSGPSITQQPQNATVQSGQTATFNVGATGTLPLAYQWQRNNVNIAGANSPSYTTPPTSVIDNGAAFRCIVSNSIGTVTSDAAILTVTTVSNTSGITSDDFNTNTLKPFWTFVNPSTPSVLSLVGTGTADARLSIAVPAGASHDVWTGANNAPRIMQPMNNTDFEVEVKFEQPMNAGYQIEGVIVEQSPGNYLRFGFVRDFMNTRLFAASFTNNTPSVKHDINITGNVGASPVGGSGIINDYLTQYAAQERGMAAQANAVDGEGTIDSGDKGEAGTTTMVSTIYLRVKRVGNSWTQSYSTNGVNFVDAPSFTHTMTAASVGPYIGNAGSSPSSAPAFTGLVDYFFNTASPISPEDGTTSPPVITTQPANQAVGVGQAATFTVGVTGSTPLQFQWQRNNANISGATNPSYQTPSAQLTDDGSQFRCIVSNAIGTVTSNNATLNVTTTSNPSGIVSDDFRSNTLDARWTFINPGVPSTLSLVGSGTPNARLSLAVPGGSNHDVWSGANNAPRIMQPMSNTDFEVEVKFEQTMTAGYQIEGVIVEQSPGNYVRFGFVRDNTNTRVFAASFVNNNPTVRTDVVITQTNPLYLRVRRTGNEWLQTYSNNGTNFISVGPFTHALAASAIGVYAGNQAQNAAAPAFTCLVDYFFNTASPIVPEDAGVTGPLSKGGGPSTLSGTLTEVKFIPTEFALKQNFPNPFNPTTTIEYDIPYESEATLAIYNTLGQEVATLVNERLSAGRYQATWNATNIASGMYFYRLSTFDKSSKPIVLMKKLVVVK